MKKPSLVCIMCAFLFCPNLTFAEQEVYTPKRMGTPSEIPTTGQGDISEISDLFDIAKLPGLKNFKTYMASSYDKRGGNYDWLDFRKNGGNEEVVLDVNGPGAIVRLWSARPRGVIKIYIDDAREPVVRDDFESFMKGLPLSLGCGYAKRGTAEYEAAMKAGKSVGRTSYYVIPFRKACKITLSPVEGASRVYYQFNYLLFDKPYELKSFTLEQLKRDKDKYAAVEQSLSWDHHAYKAKFACSEGQVSVPAGDEVTIFEQNGPLTIRSMMFSVQLPDDEKRAWHIKENLQLRAYWDEDLETGGTPNSHMQSSIKAPLAFFFMDYGLFEEYCTAFINKKEGRYSCRFPMPVRQNAVIKLVNSSCLDVEQIKFEICYEHNGGPDLSLGHFKAVYHCQDSTFGHDISDYSKRVMRTTNTDGRLNYTLLRESGRGHFVGCCFHIDYSETPYWRALVESDEAVFIDDDEARTMWGTGTEDYLNDAWGVHSVANHLSGGRWTDKNFIGNQPGARADTEELFGYRFHISDCIPFDKKMAFTLEHGSSNNCTAVYRSVAYYYLK